MTMKRLESPAAVFVLVLTMAAPWAVAQVDPAPAAEPPATAPAATAPAATGPLADMWSNMIHGIKVARPELAKANAEGILASGAQPREIYQLAMQTPEWQGLLSRGAALEGMKEPAARIRQLIEQGYEQERADPASIEKAIAMLEQGVRSYDIAAKRLELSGEYAMPQLVQKLMDPKSSEVLKERIVNVLPRMGKDAVRPLSQALAVNDPNLQVVFANALGQIGYPHAAPALKQLLQTATLDKVKQAASRALNAVVGASAAQRSLAELAYEQAEKYYSRAESLMPDARYDKANVWFWKENLGLKYEAVPREVFMDIETMRMAKMALKADPKFYPAVSLWVAANLRKESAMPKGAVDPTMAPGQPSARFYALASSAATLQDVLARALSDDTPAVAIGAIEALGQTAGAKNLARSSAGGVGPLVRALSYPDRNVRFMAAVTLAGALPDEKFDGSDMVIPVLNEALRQSGQKTALLISKDANLNATKDAVLAAGYKLIEQSELLPALAAARESAGVDVVVLGTSPDAAGVLAALRQDPVLAGLPVVIVSDVSKDRQLAQKDKRVRLAATAAAEPIAAALAEAAKVGAGEAMTPEGAAAWAARAAESLYLLGLTRNQVYDITRSRQALVTALDDTREPVRLAAGAALSVMPGETAAKPEPAAKPGPNTAAAQAALVKAATAQGDEKVRVAMFESLAQSLKRFGNQLGDAQAQAVLAVVTGKESEPVREAAAGALGAMNLPSDQAKALILETSGL
jgi:HEAT repeat protein